MKFGRYAIEDSRDHLITAPQSTRRARTWNTGPYNGNQGDTPSCVGFAWSHYLSSQPIRQYLNPMGIYQIAQHLDEWVGNNYDGTSVRGGAKVLHKFAFISEYEFTTQLDVAVNVILEEGPLVLGVNWYAGMDTPDADGHISVKGKRRGGHALLAYGVDCRSEKVGLKNSWGVNWGVNGCATLSFTDLDRLLREQGECCRAIEVKSDWSNW